MSTKLNTFLSIFSKLISASLGFLLSIYIARTYGTGGTGSYHFANKLMLIIATLGQLGLTNLIVRDIVKKKFNTDFFKRNSYINKVIWSQLGATIILLTLTIIGILFLNNIISDYFDIGIYFFITMILIAIPKTVGISLNSYYISIRKLWQGEFISNSLDKVIVLLIILFLIINEIKFNLEVLAYVFLVCSLISTFFLFFSIKKLNVFLPTLISKKLFNDSKSIISANFFTLLGKNLDLILIGYYLSVSEMGIYAIASRIPELLHIILKAINGDMSAEISKLYYDNKITELNIFVQKYIKLGFILSIFLILFTIFLGEYILSIWGEDFRSGQTIFLLLIISQAINLSTIGSSMTLTLCGLQRKMRDVTIVGVVLKIILMTLLMYQFGINGLAMAILFHSFGINVYKIYLNKKLLNLKFYPQLI